MSDDIARGERAKETWMLTEITPLPYHYAYEGSGLHGIYDASCEIMVAQATVGEGANTETATHNARYIVRACNAYPQLVAACEAAESLLNSACLGVIEPSTGEQRQNTMADALEIREILQEALAEAKKD